MLANDATDQDNSALLSSASLSALHLHDQPFADLLPHSEGQESQFSDAVTEEQLADIKQALITGDDLLLVLGEKGAGKSTLLQQLDANSGLRIQCFPVAATERFKTHNLFSGMLEAFHQEPPAKLKDLLDELIPYLQSMVARNTLCTILLDDADKVSQNELTQLLSGMMYLNSQDETLLRITLAANEEFENTIPELLPEGADLPYSSLTIEGFSTSRATAFLDHRLQTVGFDQSFPFSESDMDSLVEHSGGNPAKLQTLTADILNEQFGALEDNEFPAELHAAKAGGFMQSRFGKLALGALATLLIVGGLLMFMPKEQSTGTTTTSVELGDTNNNFANTEPQVADTTSLANSATQAAQDTVSATTDATSELAQNVSEAAAEAVADATPSTEITIVADAAATAESTANTATNAATDALEAVTTNNADNTVIQAPDETTETTTETTTEVAENTTLNSDATLADASIEASEAIDTQSSVAEASTQVQQSVQNTEEQSSESQTDNNVAAAPQQETVSEISVNGSLESPTWILVQDDEKYTVQMSASRDLKSVQDFLRRNPLPGPNSIFSFERNGDTWYALVHGTFDGLGDARQAVEQMSESAQRDQPWIRSIARVKAVLRQQ